MNKSIHLQANLYFSSPDEINELDQESALAKTKKIENVAIEYFNAELKLGKSAREIIATALFDAAMQNANGRIMMPRDIQIVHDVVALLSRDLFKELGELLAESNEQLIEEIGSLELTASHRENHEKPKADRMQAVDNVISNLLNTGNARSNK